ncbi:MAG: hypothetical protein IMW89_08525 [Ktedonobacteraceae bacterium]|nr:hypothetical protein [Ktedonobacteraceae bacterium]
MASHQAISPRATQPGSPVVYYPRQDQKPGPPTKGQRQVSNPDARLNNLETRFNSLETKVTTQLTEVIGLLQQLIGEVRDQGHRLASVEVRINTIETRLNEQQQSITTLNVFQRKMMQKMGIEYE